MRNVKPLVDAWGRSITYLRVSVTEDCNFRCIYCVPSKGFCSAPVNERFSAGEIERVVRVAAGLGVERVRLTGGEPLLRSDLLDIVRRLKAIPGLRDLSITTNGSLLEPLVQPLKAAGLDRLNISLDSLDPARFRQITQSDSYEKVYRACFAALQTGFPVKLNMVVFAGLTEEEIVRFIELAVDYPIEVRFLEFMPLCGSGWSPEKVMTIAQVRHTAQAHFELDPLPRRREVAQVYQVRGGPGRVGFIASLTESFCNTCSRMRLSVDGRLFPCLFSDRQISLKDALAAVHPDEAIAQALRRAAAIKPRGNHFADEPFDGDLPIGFSASETPLIRRIGG